MSKSTVYLIGAGPGDTGLITVKGARILAQADVILYDKLSSPDLLSSARPDAELIPVGKCASNHTMAQEDINKLLVKKAKEGNMVVRLKGGDCYLFGRGGEEAEECFNEGVPFEVVPGVTSALSAPCYAGIPPTHRDCTSNIAVVTGHRKKGDDRPIDIPKAGTVVFLMSVGNIKNIISSLLAAGYSSDTKIAAVEHGTCYDQRVITGTLDDFPNIIEKTPLRTPAIFIVGKVVEMREKLDWFSKKPRILHLGTHPDKYAHLGTIVYRPNIRCVEIEDSQAISDTLAKAASFDWIIFTSGNGIKNFFKKFYRSGQDARSLSQTKIAVIGKASAETLLTFGIKADICSKLESSKGLLEAFAEIEVKGKNILLPQAEVASKELPEGLTQRGAVIEKMPVYRTEDIEMADVDLDYIDQIIFTSSSTINAFVKKFGSVPDHIKSYCLGVPTQNTAKSQNIDAEILPKN